ncbi:MAG: carbohydrate ABC transporter permease [Eubacteriales bacterium]|nr:carbohydrate ABC transporter permease [Eubacteriales bacterium]
MKRRKMTLGRGLLYLFAIVCAVLWLAPVVWMILASLKPQNSAVTILSNLVKGPFTFENYVEAAESEIWLWMKNSLILGVLSTLGAVAVDSMAAYALSYLRYPGKKAVFWFIMVGMMIPVEAEIIPLYQEMVEFGLMNSYASIVLPALAGPFGVFILKQFYDGIPRELAEAARMDGAGYFRIFANIFVPLSKSSIFALGIFLFIGSWNNFLWPFMTLTSSNKMTVPVGLPMFNSLMGSDMVMPMAAAFLSSIPTIIVFLFFQKHIIKGITMTGIKG